MFGQARGAGTRQAPTGIRRAGRLRGGAALGVLVAGMLAGPSIAGPDPATGGSASLPSGSQPGRPTIERLYERGLQHVDLRRLQDLYQELEGDAPGLWGVDLPGFVRSMGREGLPGPQAALEALLGLLVRELALNVRLLARVLAVATLGALLQQLGRGLGGRGVQEVATAAVVLSLSWLALQSFGVAAAMVVQAVGHMAAVAQALIPTLTAISVPGGVSAAGLALHPLLVGVVSLSADLVRRVVVPALLAGCAVGVAGCISAEFPLSRLARLLQQGAMAALGLSLTVFLGLVAVKGAMAPAADGVALRTVKFVTGSAVPVFGRMMADAVEVVAGASLLLRGVVGAAGTVLVLVAAVAPAVKLLSIMFVFGVSAALLQPAGDPRVQAVLGVLADTLGLLLAALAATTVLSVVAVATMAQAGAGWIR